MLQWVNFHLTIEENFGRDSDMVSVSQRAAVFELQRSRFEDETWNQSALPCHCARDTETAHPQLIPHPPGKSVAQSINSLRGKGLGPSLSLLLHLHFMLV